MTQFKFTHLTFNTMGAPFKPKTKWRFEKIGGLLIKLTKEKDIDFITLQETFNKELRDQYIIQPWENEFSYFRTTNEHGWHLGQSGLTTLSRWKITESQFKGFRRSQWVDCGVYKGALFTRIKLESGLIDVYNVHPQATYFYYNRRAKVRISQIQELLQLVHQTHDSQLSALITGDLNCEEHAEEYDIMVQDEVAFTDVMRGIYPDKNTHPLETFISDNPKKERKIDHVLFHSGPDLKWVPEESSTEVIDFGLSDHRAILSTITCRPAKSA